MYIIPQLIARRLRDAGVGELVTYAELNDLIGRDAKTHGLRTALKELRKERLIFGCVENEGYRRLNDAEIVATGRIKIRHINRAARRNIEVLAAADFDKLSADQKLQHNTAMTVSALAAASTGADSVKRVEGRVRDTNSALPAGKAAIVAIGSIDDAKQKAAK